MIFDGVRAGGVVWEGQPDGRGWSSRMGNGREPDEAEVVGVKMAS